MTADGLSLDAIRARLGHKSVAVLLGYICRAQAWDEKAGTAGSSRSAGGPSVNLVRLRPRV